MTRGGATRRGRPMAVRSIRLGLEVVAALTTYSKGLSKEVGARGIRVNTVAPGFIETTAAQRLIAHLAKKAGTDEGTARQDLMDSLGGMPAV